MKEIAEVAVLEALFFFFYFFESLDEIKSHEDC